MVYTSLTSRNIYDDLDIVDWSVDDDDEIEPSGSPGATAELPPANEVEPLHEFLYYRYGYTASESIHSDHISVSGAFDGTTPFKDCSHILHTIGAQLVWTSEEKQAPLKAFLSALVDSDTPLRHVPARFWDLGATNAKSLTKLLPRIRIQVKRFTSGTQYLIRPFRCTTSAEDVPWVIAVSPMTALELIRRDRASDPKAIALYLLGRGFTFRTLQPVLPIRPPLHLPSSTAPLYGTRQIEYAFDAKDWRSYENLRNSYILSHSRFRSATSSNSLIIRIMKDVLGAGFINSVLAGPTQAALEGKQAIFELDTDVMVDDDLSDFDLDLVCGTYEIKTGKGGSPVSLIYFQFKLNSYIVSPNRHALLVSPSQSVGTFHTQHRILESRL
jgi:hypothetical protein